MRRVGSAFTAFGLACAGLLLAAAPALAQNSSFGSNSSSGNSGFGSFGGNSSSGNSSFGNSSSLGSNSSSGNSFLGGTSGSNSNSFLGGTSGTTTTGRTGSTSTVPGSTSFLGANYGNVLGMGLGTNSSTTATGPAFGTVLYKLTNTSTTTRTATSTTNQNNTSYGSGVGVRRLPAYATTLRIKDAPPPPTAAAVQLDVQNMIAQSPQLDSRDSVRIRIDGPAVVLQGQVVDDEERRLVENMVRLTPGVGVIRNELAARSP